MLTGSEGLRTQGGRLPLAPTLASSHVHLHGTSSHFGGICPSPHGEIIGESKEGVLGEGLPSPLQTVTGFCLSTVTRNSLPWALEQGSPPTMK